MELLQLTGSKGYRVEFGDEVLTQSLSFVATSNSIVLNGANPIFIDVDIDTMGMSPASLKNFLKKNVKIKNNNAINKKSGKTIKACLPVHVMGFSNRIKEICNICKEFKIPVIEDAAESFGSYNGSKMTGSFGQIGIYSLNGNKIITSGGGGLIVGNDIKLMNIIKHLSTQAKIDHKWEYCDGYL